MASGRYWTLFRGPTRQVAKILGMATISPKKARYASFAQNIFSRLAKEMARNWIEFVGIAQVLLGGWIKQCYQRVMNIASNRG